MVRGSWVKNVGEPSGALRRVRGLRSGWLAAGQERRASLYPKPSGQSAVLLPNTSLEEWKNSSLRAERRH
jgi:hypothetical protein